MNRVLVIDDDPSICNVLEKILASCGFSVTVAMTGHAGLDAATKEPFAAAIVDLCIPDIGGLRIIRALRTQTPEIRVIAMSGLMSEQLGLPTPDFLGMTADLHGVPRLAKPFRRKDLLDVLGVPAPAMANRPMAV